MFFFKLYFWKPKVELCKNISKNNVQKFASLQRKESNKMLPTKFFPYTFFCKIMSMKQLYRSTIISKVPKLYSALFRYNE